MEIKEGSFIYFARKDIILAKHDFSVDMDSTCIHCQQAIEKSLKAVIEAKGGKPPHTHNLTVLADKTGIESLKELDSDLRFISSTYFDLRYPGSYMPITEKSAKLAIALAESIYSTCISEIESICTPYETTSIFSE